MAARVGAGRAWAGHQISGFVQRPLTRVTVANALVGTALPVALSSIRQVCGRPHCGFHSPVPCAVACPQKMSFVGGPTLLWPPEDAGLHTPFTSTPWVTVNEPVAVMAHGSPF